VFEFASCLREPERAKRNGFMGGPNHHPQLLIPRDVHEADRLLPSIEALGVTSSARHSARTTKEAFSVSVQASSTRASVMTGSFAAVLTLAGVNQRLW
jgi:hypothetical protein